MVMVLLSKSGHLHLWASKLTAVIFELLKKAKDRAQQ
jgi:hypothetical protein